MTDIIDAQPWQTEVYASALEEGKVVLWCLRVCGQRGYFGEKEGPWQAGQCE